MRTTASYRPSPRLTNDLLTVLTLASIFLPNDPRRSQWLLLGIFTLVLAASYYKRLFIGSRLALIVPGIILIINTGIANEDAPPTLRMQLLMVVTLIMFIIITATNLLSVLLVDNRDDVNVMYRLTSGVLLLSLVIYFGTPWLEPLVTFIVANYRSPLAVAIMCFVIIGLSLVRTRPKKRA